MARATDQLSLQGILFLKATKSDQIKERQAPERRKNELTTIVAGNQRLITSFMSG
jgi:hypothetical protein